MRYKLHLNNLRVFHETVCVFITRAVEISGIGITDIAFLGSFHFSDYSRILRPHKNIFFKALTSRQ